MEGCSVAVENEVQIAKLFAKLMIARPDVRAIQKSDGEYRPQYNEKFAMPDLLDHINGRKTYGHYLVSPDDKVKLFCFDIDLKKIGKLPITKNGIGMFLGFQDANPREVWGSRRPGAARDFMKLKMKIMANQLMSKISKELEIPTAAAYSGSKGVHVYGFTGKTTATLARQAASIVLDACREDNMGYWDLIRGNNFYGYKTDHMDDPTDNNSQFELEVYPKQETVEGREKGLGNLLRLPLGVNLHSPRRDKGFFIDMRTALTDFVPRDPVEALTISNPWQ
jgi:hypothetical protein